MEHASSFFGEPGFGSFGIVETNAAVGFRKLEPIQSNRVTAIFRQVRVLSTSVIVDQLFECAIRLYVAIGKEIRFALEVQRVFFNGRSRPSRGGQPKLVGRFGEDGLMQIGVRGSCLLYTSPSPRD